MGDPRPSAAAGNQLLGNHDAANDEVRRPRTVPLRAEDGVDGAQATDVDIDRLGAALARLLAEWWRQRDRQEAATPRSGDAGAETAEHNSASPSVPTASSVAVPAQ